VISLCARLALCLTVQMSNHGAHLGEHFASRNRYHLDRWRAALAAGLAKRQCIAIARSTGLRCRGIPLKFSDKCRCHCLRSERIVVDAKRLPWLQAQLMRAGNADVRANVEARIARIERRRLRWVWRTDPTVEGATISLKPRDCDRVHVWLRSVGVDAEALTARALDRCRWAGALFLSKRTSEATGLKSVAVALRDERQWRAKTGEVGAPLNPSA
jgi:hypothetical protein